MKLRHTLPLAFTASVLISLVSGLSGLYLQDRALRHSSEAVQDCFAKERAVGYLAVINQVKESEWKSILLNAADPAARARHWTVYQAVDGELAQKAKALQPTLSAPSGALLGEFNGRIERLRSQHLRDYRAIAAGTAAPALVEDDSGALLAQAIGQLKQESMEITEQALQGSAQTLLHIAAVMTAIGVAVLAASIALSRAIVGPIGAALGMAQAVSQGDLTARITLNADNELGQMAAALREMAAALTRIVRDVRAFSDTICSTSEGLDAGNADLARRTESQASALEQTASSMEQLSATVQQNASSARQASQLAAQVSSEAGSGRQAVEQVVQTMRGIQEAAGKIADINSVIDGIAFQTNILALNAAVEAARAGAQGQGFAVVAAEVRMLAQRSAQAAHEIKELIGASLQEVQKGAQQVDYAGQAIGQLVGSVERVNALIGDIARASDEQALGVGQINVAIGAMEQATQQNSAVVEAAAQAAGSLHQQADALQRTVQLFKLEGAP